MRFSIANVAQIRPRARTLDQILSVEASETILGPAPRNEISRNSAALVWESHLFSEIRFYKWVSRFLSEQPIYL